MENAWESEDGPSLLGVCERDGWTGPAAWLDDERVAVGGFDDEGHVAGARIFDISARMNSGRSGRAEEAMTFAGPAGTFFSDGKWLFSSDETGLSRWDPETGERTGHLPTFWPSRYHRGARELVELRDGRLVRLAV
jgi:hypothetical protein